MKKNILLILLLIGIGILIVGISNSKEEQDIETFNVNAQTEQEIKDEIIIAAFMQNIRQVVESYYTQNMSRDVTVYDYETTILDVEKTDGGNIQIKFGVTPQVGAHNPIGYDEIIFTIDANGNKKIVDYQHIGITE